MDTSSKTEVAKIIEQYWRSSGSSWQKCVRAPTCRSLVGKTVRGSLVGTWMGKSAELSAKFYSHRHSWMVSKWLERNRIRLPCGRNWWNERIYYRTVQRDVSITYFCRSNWNITRVCKTSRTDVCVVLRYGRACPTEQFYKVSSLFLDDHHFMKEELESVEELSELWSQIVFKCLFLTRIGRPDIPWSVNQLARSVTTWTGARDKGSARLISYLHHTSTNRQCCHVGNTAQQCRFGLSQDSDFAGDLEDSKSTSGEGLNVSLGSRTFVTMSWLCKKRTSVSHNSTESETISLDAGLRMDGWPAQNLWDVVMEVLRSSTSTKTPTNPVAGNFSR